MDPYELAALAEPVLGPRWPFALSRELGYPERTVRGWAVDGIPAASAADEVRAFLSLRASIRLLGPGNTRGAGAHDSPTLQCEPVIAAVVGAGRDAGFGQPAMLAAILAAAVRGVVRTAGTAAAIDALKREIEDLEP